MDDRRGWVHDDGNEFRCPCSIRFTLWPLLRILTRQECFLGPPTYMAVTENFLFSFPPGDHHVYAIDEQDVISMGANMVTTGQLTTPIIMYTLLGMLVCHQDIQQRAYNEIRAAIGDRTPNQEDKYKLPYMEARILESMRYGTNAPSNPAHCTSRDTMLGGYFIPKGTLVIQNNWSISHDPR